MVGIVNIYSLPKYKELSVKLIYDYIKSNDDLKVFFPDYPIETLPNKDFLMGVISTVRPDETYTLIKTARDNRSTKGDEDLGQLIKIENSIKDEILGVLTHKSNPNLTHIPLL